MKEITETIKKFSPEEIRELGSRLGLKKKAKKDLISALTTITGLHNLLKTLDTGSLRILMAIYETPEGVTFVEIQKKLKIEINAIEKSTEALSRGLLIYTIKNRQMLHSKMDKAYGISEIAELLHIVEPAAITDRLHKNYLHLETSKINKEHIQPVRDRETKEFLKFMAESGCVISLDTARDHLPSKSAEKILHSLLSQNLVHVFQCYRPEFNTYLVLNEKACPTISFLDDTDEPGKKLAVCNRYFILNNLLHAYDVISTFGLFLTKQQEFRKIDIRRISEAMLPLRDMGGTDLPVEESAQLSMFLLNRLGCLKMNKDIAGISLFDLRNDIGQPLMLLRRILKSIEPGTEGGYFTPPFEMPRYECVKSIIRLLHKLKSVSHRYLQITLLTRSLSESDEPSFGDRLMDLAAERERFGITLNFLCITGIIDVDGGRISLSDIGMNLASHILKAYSSAEEEPARKNIYINPDFTLVIPARELPSDALYHLLTHTDIIKHDIIINAIISKASIVRAQKRGMTLDRFLESLSVHSRNEVPQNLAFLLKEWSNQTINVGISQTILLTTSHPEFIDELLMGMAKDGITERISHNHALLKKEYIDEIIKIARKKDAVISLFNEIEEED